MSTTINAEGASTEFLADDSYGQMVGYLENILMRHLSRLRSYDLDGAMLLAEESNDLALKIGDAGVLERPEFADERRRIFDLYNEIGLIIASEREEVANKLQSIRKGIKTLGAYSGH
jgi:hypothetical protein